MHAWTILVLYMNLGFCNSFCRHLLDAEEIGHDVIIAGLCSTGEGRVSVNPAGMKYTEKVN